MSGPLIKHWRRNVHSGWGTRPNVMVIQPAITCALLLMSFRATDFLVMRGTVEVVWLIVEGGGMDDADGSATTST